MSSTERTRGRLREPKREAQTDRSRRHERQQHQTRNPLRHLIFELRPDEIRDLLESEISQFVEEESKLLDELLENDSDLTAEDEDDADELEDKQYDSSQYDLWLPSSLAARLPLGAEPAPFLDLSRIWTLSVAPPASGHQMSCVFDEPSWAARAARNRADRMKLQYVRRPIAFLRSTADWLEQNCQTFLKDPLPVRFAEAQGNFSNTPIVLQDGFRERINATLPEFLRVEKDSFTRLIRNVWLLWPNESLPIQELFSEEFRQAWVAVGAMYGIKPADWQVDEFRSFTKEQAANLERKDFRKLSQEERLHFLYRRVKVRAAAALKAVQAQKDRLASLARATSTATR